MLRRDVNQYRARLEFALKARQSDGRSVGGDLFRVVRAAVRAVVPGRQQAKNLDPLMRQALTAAVRVLRRR